MPTPEARSTDQKGPGQGAQYRTEPPLRSVAYYLPQYHPIPENDEWWEPGFTEWFNVVRARPLFKGHHQPHLPADLGFYDLRVADTRQQQADLALEYGISAFCYFHYWFEGRQLLQRPLTEVLKSGSPRFPFLLCWANENWTRGWDTSWREVLIAQTWSENDDLAHIRWLCPVFADSRYLRIDGKPVFLVYRSGLLPQVQRTMDVWRSEAVRLGVGELYIVRVESHHEVPSDPASMGFDAATEFQPDTRVLMEGQSKPARLARRLFSLPVRRQHSVQRYSSLVDRSLRQEVPPYKRYPCVTPSWDNSARRVRSALILTGSSPEEFGRWMTGVVRSFTPYSADENLVFVNAWNEWAEGNHLEPCQRFGRAYLEAHRAAIGHR